MSTCRVESIQCGLAKPLSVGGRTVLSGIGKQAVVGACRVTALGLAGDEQADLSVHGGLDKAVYAYPVEHLSFWQDSAQERADCGSVEPGRLGENLSISGLLEDQMYVGDTWHFPNCVLRVSQPRIPCAKLCAVLADKRAARRMAESGRCGTYLSVVSAGQLTAGDVFTVQAGRRDTPLLSLFKVSRAKTRFD